MSEPSAKDQFDEATEALRSTARWLVSGLTGVAALLIAGVPFSGLADLHANQWPRILGAAAAIVLGLSSLAITMHRTSEVLTADWVTLARLTDQHFLALMRQSVPNSEMTRQEKDLINIHTKICETGEELFRDVAKDIGELHERLRLANEEAAVAAFSKSQPPSEFDHMVARVERLKKATQNVIAYANYEQTRLNSIRMRKTIYVAMPIVLGAAAAFTYATHTSSAFNIRIV